MSAINKVILIDDDEVVNFFDKVVINKLGIDDNVITTHGTVAEAIKDLANYNTKGLNQINGIILLDIQMPDLDGWDFLELYEKSIDEYVRNHFKLLMLTSDKTDHSDKLEKYQHLIFDYLKKPLTLNDMESVLKHIPA